MNAGRLKKWYSERSFLYRELAGSCGSVAELVLRLEAYGDRWTSWDWVMFLSYLDLSAARLSENASWNFQPPPAEPSPEESLLADVFGTLDGGTALDGVLTNRTVIMNLIDWAGSAETSGMKARQRGALSLLAHVFAKFPDLWRMNWMFIRRRGRRRVHRLEFTLLELSSGRGPRYLESRAYLDDFVNRYWNPSERGRG